MNSRNEETPDRKTKTGTWPVVKAVAGDDEEAFDKDSSEDDVS